MASSKASASSSSSKPTGGWTYDVFLSFRGEDTRNNFVDHLYAALVQKGIHTFKDDEMIHRGESISSELMRAIEESRFAVVVFSKNYANSSWCLDELAHIMKCRDEGELKVILPVFYHVDPSDVRKQKGEYATAFQKHEENFNDGEKNDEVNKWRGALAGAANLSGHHISDATGGEFSVINKIIKDIMGKMKPRGMEDNLIGIESHMDALTLKLSIQKTQEVLIIGILGMGGIGKTTIAQAFFRRISFKFEGSSFIKNVREGSSTTRDVCALQEKILIDVLGTHLEFMIQDPEDGVNIIQERFCKKKVLIVLDDVDDVRQLKFLAGSDTWFGPGSRILITTRDEHLLSYANEKYTPALLRMDQAVELFSRHAFRKNSPPEGFKELSDRAISYTGRLPLALKILGSFFHGRETEVWESAIDRLAKIPNHEVQEVIEAIVVSKECTDDGKHQGLRSNVFERMNNLRLLIEGIVVPKKYMKQQGFRSNVFERMNNLRLLDVNDKFTSHEPSFLPKELRWISWNNYPFSSLPVPQASKLVGLKMIDANIKHLWKGQKKWAAVDQCLSIGIPGSKIPSWFREQQKGGKMSLKLRPKWQTQILGFAICGVFGIDFGEHVSIVFRFENTEMFVPKLEADMTDAPPAAKDGSVFLNYIPFSSFEKMHDDYNDFQWEDWSHITEGKLVIDYFSTFGPKALRCGALAVYKEDVESIQQIKPSLSSYYWNCKLTQTSANTFSCTD
ncbi:hypothetical protein SSX86_019952 [Deinandra increscens subsp. villosa]|uniref:ADP-ribosyl cyclase/cyclic ADP-ribose hydrolase n=1 Tax=Deinandra increscens subsp. villosa TaxID=3103831 RepID=A0AAP0CYW1_9ASTR